MRPAREIQCTSSQALRRTPSRYRDSYDFKNNEHSSVPIAGRPTAEHKQQHPRLKLFCEMREAATEETYYIRG